MRIGVQFRYYRALLVCIVAVIFLNGCALVKPTRRYEETTPIDEGLAGANQGTAVVLPFVAKDLDIWGAYAARSLREHLLEHKAFHTVAPMEDKVSSAEYIVTGSIDYIGYGGSESPTVVFLTVKVVARSGSKTLFYRTVKASSQKSAFHMTWLRRVDVPSPDIEAVMTVLLEKIAVDIASRTQSPAVQHP